MYRRTVRRGLGAASTSIQSLITSVANQFSVPPSIALAVAQKESNFNQAAVGSSGEIGVMQLMPATAAGLNVDPTNLDQNVQGGISLLASLYQQYGNWTQALEAYNAGPTAVNAGAVPTSSVSYASSILGSVNLDSTPSSLDSLTAELTDGLPDLQSVSGTSPWVWAGVALAGFGLLWWASEKLLGGQ
jgi:soluble lytic murein transglycosylase-like protein